MDIDNTTLRRVQELTGVHLLEAIDGDLVTRLSTDPLLLGDVLFAICKPQADDPRNADYSHEPFFCRTWSKPIVTNEFWTCETPSLKMLY